MNRMGHMIRLNPQTKAEYLRLHRETWPEILAIIAQAGIRNYSIFLREPEDLLFGYWEYHGTDYEADMARLAAEPRMQDWWAITDPMQTRLESVSQGEHWAPMAQVFFTDQAPDT
ncbi:MAG: L-rhamnose mutarotase [Pseudomonadota bacterium]